MLQYNNKNYYPQYEAIYFNGNIVYGHEHNATEFDFLDVSTLDWYEGGLLRPGSLTKYVYEVKQEVIREAPEQGGVSRVQVTLTRKKYVQDTLKESKVLLYEVKEHTFDENTTFQKRTEKEEYTYIDTELENKDQINYNIIFVQKAHEDIITEVYKLGEEIERQDAPYIGGPGYAKYYIIKETYTNGIKTQQEATYDVIEALHDFNQTNNLDQKKVFTVTVPYKNTSFDIDVYQEAYVYTPPVITYEYIVNKVQEIKAPVEGGLAKLTYEINKVTFADNTVENYETFTKNYQHTFDENTLEEERTYTDKRTFEDYTFDVVFTQEGLVHVPEVTYSYSYTYTLTKIAPNGGGVSEAEVDVLRTKYYDGVQANDTHILMTLGFKFNSWNSAMTRKSRTYTHEWIDPQTDIPVYITITYEQYAKWENDSGTPNTPEGGEGPTTPEEGPETPDTPVDPIERPDIPDLPSDTEVKYLGKDITDFSTDIDDYEDLTFITNINDQDTYKAFGIDMHYVDDVLIGPYSIKKYSSLGTVFFDNTDIKQYLNYNTPWFAVTIKLKKDIIFNVVIRYVSGTIIIAPRNVKANIIVNDNFDYEYYIRDVYTYENSTVRPPEGALQDPNYKTNFHYKK